MLNPKKMLIAILIMVLLKECLMNTVNDCATYDSNSVCTECSNNKKLRDIIDPTYKQCVYEVTDCQTYGTDGKCETCIGDK